MYSRMPKRPYVSTSSSPATKGSERERFTDRQGVYVPPNYSGTAIGMESQPTPHFEDLPQVSNLPQPTAEVETPTPPQTDALPPRADTPHESLPALATPTLVQKNESFLGGLLNSTHFPFGHGLGFEELFLLGLLLFLMHEDKDTSHEDSDLPLTLLLVGALLFCG